MQLVVVVLIVSSCSSHSVRTDDARGSTHSSNAEHAQRSAIVAERDTTCLSAQSAYCWGGLPHGIEWRARKIAERPTSLFLLGWQPCHRAEGRVVCVDAEETPGSLARFQGNGIEPLEIDVAQHWLWARTERAVYRSAIRAADTDIERVFGRNVSLVSGNEHACILDRHGIVHCIGANDQGQCGVETSRIRQPVRVGVARTLSAGWHHTCALSAEGAVYCWGSPYDYEFDWQFQEPADDAWRPRLVELPARAVSITSTQAGACAALTDGTVRCWGRVERFSTSGPAALRIEPYEVRGLPVAHWHLAAGSDHVCALREGTTNEVWCWGDNRGGQVGAGLGDASVPRPVEGVEATSVVAVGEQPATCAQTNDGTRCWGWGFGDSVASLRIDGVIQAAAGNSLLADDGRVWRWEPGSPPRALDIRARALAEAEGRACHVTSNGRTLTCTDADGTTSRRLPMAAKDVVLTGAHECVLYESGQLACRAESGFEIVRENVRLACGAQLRLCVLDERARCRFGEEDWREVQLGDDVQQISCGGGRVCAVDSEGAVQCERTRRGAVDRIAVPRATAVAVGRYHQCILAGRRVYCSGSGGFDGNVLGRREDVLPPTRVVGLDS